MKTVTAEMAAWIYTDNPQSLEGFSHGDADRMVDAVSLFPKTFCQGRDSFENLVRIGVAQITLTIDGEHDLTSRAIDGLREQQERIRAEAERKCNELQESINRMLAISYDAEVI